MTDNNKRNNETKAEASEKPTTERLTSRQTNRTPRRTERERIERPERTREGVYGPATSSLPAGRNLSWASILAGAVTAAACFATLSLLTAALGFGLFSPTNANPLAGVGFGTGLWTAITFAISFLAGGFIAGYSARSTGKLHGAITWAVTILLLLTLVINAISQIFGAAVNVAGSVAGTAANVAGEVAGSTISSTSDAVSAGVEKAAKAIEDVDTEDLQANVEQYLADTDIPELQPDYLNNQLQESRDEITQAVKDIALNPNNANSIIAGLTSSLQDKAKTIADSADKEAIANSVAANSNLTEAEAEEVTNNIYDGLVEANKQAQVALDNASVEINKFAAETQETVDQTVEDVKEGAEDASNKASAGSVVSFFGLIVALALSAWGGQKGEEKALAMVRR